jgi:hypothetical protein
MTTRHVPLNELSDAQLLDEVRRLATCERAATAQLIRSLMELDARRLYLAEGFSSLFTYCTQALGLSEHAAYGRIEAARAARRFPAILDLLEEGAITLTTVTLVAAHLSPENQNLVLAEVRHKSKREVEQLVARLRPLPDIAPSVRKLPVPKLSPPSIPHVAEPTSAQPVKAPVMPARAAIVAPLTEER